ncbi:UNVERIFIED_CONTAM: Vesicle trafficking between the ER and Golgi [Siphonaria sp. JEL0065]|nr:Vesicle trafficking between the ER and Golgi [Siphonaria sp. JEL0065]
MLNFNNKEAATSKKPLGLDYPSDGARVPQLIETIWKVLVYDKAGQDIISQLLKVNELRENGVTVHMPLFTDRQPLADVPAIYFVEPTPENIRRISDDLGKNLYESYYLNFTYTISRNLLEELAAASIAANTSVQIAQVYDQYLNYISLDERLFSLNFNDTYKVLNDTASTDRRIDTVTENIVSSLFSVFETWTYLTEDKGLKDIDANDFFWNKNSGNPFPQVADDVNSEITRYKKDVNDVTKNSGLTSLIQSSSNAETLKYALTALPELIERKRTLDMHMNIATALFEIINTRKLETFFAMEEAMRRQNKTTVLETLRDTEKNAEDKHRFFLVFYLSHDDLTKEDMASYEEALGAAGVSLGALTYLKSVKSFIKMAAASTVSAVTPVQSACRNIEEHWCWWVNSRVSNLLPSRKDLASTRIVESIMEGSTAGTDAEEYLQLDPKASRALAAGGGGKPSQTTGAGGRGGFQNAIVFVVGGGNYLEYQNLQDYAQRSQQKKKITYGSTEIVTAKAFLTQLEALGKLSKMSADQFPLVENTAEDTSSDVLSAPLPKVPADVTVTGPICNESLAGNSYGVVHGNCL